MFHVKKFSVLYELNLKYKVMDSQNVYVTDISAVATSLKIDRNKAKRRKEE